MPDASSTTDTRPNEADLLAAYLAGRDVICPVCGYNLYRCESDHCSECGAHLELGLTSVDLRLTSWIVSVIAITLPLAAR